jgi:hypothetical protein
MGHSIPLFSTFYLEGDSEDTANTYPHFQHVKGLPARAADPGRVAALR